MKLELFEIAGDEQWAFHFGHVASQQQPKKATGTDGLHRLWNAPKVVCVKYDIHFPRMPFLRRFIFDAFHFRCIPSVPKQPVTALIGNFADKLNVKSIYQHGRGLKSAFSIFATSNPNPKILL